MPTLKISLIYVSYLQRSDLGLYTNGGTQIFVRIFNINVFSSGHVNVKKP